MTLYSQQHQIIPVILCGGSGTRLWLLSRAGFPKQFLVLSGDGYHQSLFQQAIHRIHSVANEAISLGGTVIVTNEEHRFLALDQLRELKGASNSFAATLLLEGWQSKVDLKTGLINAYNAMLQP